MAERLKSILRRTRWSSLLKAAIFAAAWLVLPFWLFAIVALYLCFVPVPQSATVAGPFFALLLVAFLNPPGWTFAVILGCIFFALLLIKGFILIDRESAYEAVILSITFLLFLAFYEKAGSAIGWESLGYSFGVALVAGFLVSNFVRFAAPSHVPPDEGALAGDAGAEAREPDDDEAMASESRISRFGRPAVWLATLLVWEFLLAALFLPLDFVYQTIAAFLGAIVVIDLVPQHLFGTLSRAKVLVTASIVFVLFVFILGSARWGL
ncbi:MAG TPA: hypothetical protein VMT99_03085 [Candidatus Paceibacterota bacterium]|nr:hypothetical protein [Candidatus Paceibacterota bacterium]